MVVRRYSDAEGEERAYDDALDVYEKIVTLDPTEVDAYLWMGQIYNSFLQDPESALEVYRKAYALEPDSMTSDGNQEPRKGSGRNAN